MNRLSWQATALLCVLIVAGTVVWSVERARPRYRFEKVKHGQFDRVYRIDLETNETVQVKPGEWYHEAPLVDQLSHPVSEWDEWAQRLGIATNVKEMGVDGWIRTMGLLAMVIGLASWVFKLFK